MRYTYLLFTILCACSTTTSDVKKYVIVKNMEDFFYSRDSDKNGSISWKEFSKDVDRARYGSPDIMSEIRRDFNVSDKNADGLLTLNELITPRLEWFSCLDLNKDDTISNDEMNLRVGACSDVGLSTTEVNSDNSTNSIFD